MASRARAPRSEGLPGLPRVVEGAQRPLPLTATASRSREGGPTSPGGGSEDLDHVAGYAPPDGAPPSARPAPSLPSPVLQKTRPKCLWERLFSDARAVVFGRRTDRPPRQPGLRRSILCDQPHLVEPVWPVTLGWPSASGRCSAAWPYWPAEGRRGRRATYVSPHGFPTPPGQSPSRPAPCRARSVPTTRRRRRTRAMSPRAGDSDVKQLVEGDGLASTRAAPSRRTFTSSARCRVGRSFLFPASIHHRRLRPGLCPQVQWPLVTLTGSGPHSGRTWPGHWPRCTPAPKVWRLGVISRLYNVTPEQPGVVPVAIIATVALFVGVLFRIAPDWCG